MRFINTYNEESLPEGSILDSLNDDLEEAVASQDYERAKQIKELMETLIADNDAYKKKYNLGEYWFQDILQEDIRTSNFTLTQKQFFEYMNLSNKILKYMYPNSYRSVKTEAGTINLLTALPTEKQQGRDYSVLNKVNTNIKLLNTIVTKFGLKSFDELLKFIRKQREELFRESGRYFSVVFDTIRSTELVGEKSEERVCQYLKELTKKKYDIDIDPVREVTSSYKDMVLGIDISFTINNRECTVQVKPLKGSKEKDGIISVISSGRVKKYKTDYMAFVSASQIILFRNDDRTKVSGTIFRIPKENLVA